MSLVSLEKSMLELAGYSALTKERFLFEQGCNLAKLQQELLPLLQFSQTIKQQGAQLQFTLPIASNSPSILS